MYDIRTEDAVTSLRWMGDLSSGESELQRQIQAKRSSYSILAYTRCNCTLQFSRILSMGEDSILHILRFHLGIRIFAQHWWREILTSSWPPIKPWEPSQPSQILPSSLLFPQTLVRMWPIIFCMAKISMWSELQDTDHSLRGKSREVEVLGSDHW